MLQRKAKICQEPVLVFIREKFLPDSRVLIRYSLNNTRPATSSHNGHISQEIPDLYSAPPGAMLGSSKNKQMSLTWSMLEARIFPVPCRAAVCAPSTGIPWNTSAPLFLWLPPLIPRRVWGQGVPECSLKHTLCVAMTMQLKIDFNPSDKLWRGPWWELVLQWSTSRRPVQPPILLPQLQVILPAQGVLSDVFGLVPDQLWQWEVEGCSFLSCSRALWLRCAQGWWGVPFIIPLATASSSTHHPLVEDLWDTDPKVVPVPADPACCPCSWWPCTGHSCWATVTHSLPLGSQEQTPCCYIFFQWRKTILQLRGYLYYLQNSALHTASPPNIPKCLLT